MRVEPFRSEDYYKADLANGAGLEKWGMTVGVESVLACMASSGNFRTLWRGDKVFLIAGWLQAWRGVCEVSLYPTKAFVRNPIGALVLVQKQLKTLAQENRRVQLVCRKEKKFYSFAIRLGFRYEGTLRKYGYDKDDYIMMSIVEGDNE